MRPCRPAAGRRAGWSSRRPSSGDGPVLRTYFAFPEGDGTCPGELKGANEGCLAQVMTADRKEGNGRGKAPRTAGSSSEQSRQARRVGEGSARDSKGKRMGDGVEVWAMRSVRTDAAPVLSGAGPASLDFIDRTGAAASPSPSHRIASHLSSQQRPARCLRAPIPSSRPRSPLHTPFATYRLRCLRLTGHC